MKYALTNMFILNGHEDMTPISGKAILVEEGRIKDIVDANEVPMGYTLEDLHGGYLLPGLINMHVHIPGGGKPSKKKKDFNKIAKLLRFAAVRKVMYELCAGYAKLQLFSGTTTIRSMGGILDIDSRLRDAIDAGKQTGPRILAANYAVSVPGGHMTGSVAQPVTSAEGAAQMVRDQAKYKPDIVKVMITGGVLDAEVPGEPGVLRMPPEYVKAACDAAHELGYKVAAHVESTEGMVVALQNGVDTCEHGGVVTPEVLELFRKTGSVMVTTFSPAIPFAEMPQSVTNFSDMDVFNGKAFFNNMISGVKTCLQEGITVGLGTDTGCPFVTHYDMWRELWYFCRYTGVTPAFAIHTATEINAAIAGLSDETGTVDIGKSADFMVVEKNPLEDIEALRTAKTVIFRGKLYRDPKVKKYADVEKALDDMM